VVPSAAVPTCPQSVPDASPAGLGLAGWWRDRVFYEVFVRSFADGDGDGVGDLAGLIAHLDYLNDGDPATTDDLGVTGLWLMPILPSPSYHGYDVTDYRSVNPSYGSLDDLRTLVRMAHRRGIAVLLDMPLNHTSDQHPWFRESRDPASARATWYVWSAEPQGSGWHRDGSRFYYGAFGSGLPDLNLRNPAVTTELADVARYWLTDVGVDGFRIDAAKHLVEEGPVTENTPGTHAWLRSFGGTVHGTAPGALLVGEVWDPSSVSSSYVPGDLDMTFEFGLASSYVSAAATGRASTLGRVLEKVTSLYPQGGFGAFLTNHDMDRTASQVPGGGELRTAATLLLTGPGVPFVYYGEEIGMTGTKPDERLRAPMRWDSSPTAGFSRVTPWEALSSDPLGVDVADQSRDPGSLLSLYRTLIALRAHEPALARGELTALTSTSSSVLATIRRTPGRTLLVLVNLAPEPVSDYALSLSGGPLCGAPRARLVYGVGQPSAPSVTSSGGLAEYRPLPGLPAQSVTILALEP
jgi:alpha-amylase